MAGLSGNAGASPPSARDTLPLSRCRPGSGAGVPGAVAPCIRKPKNSPFPMGEERSASAGRGDREKKFMMRQAQPATKTAVPPIGDSDGRVIRQRRGKPPAWRRIAPPAPASPGFRRRGVGGGSPRRNKPKISPFPTGGRGAGGWGKNLVIWLVNPATEKSNHPSNPTAAKKTVSRRRRTPLPPCSQSTSSTRQSGRTVRSDGCSTYRRISLKAEA